MRKNYIFVIMFIAIFSLSSCTPFFLKTPDDYLAENLERFWTKEAYDRAAYRIFQSAKPGVEFNQFLVNMKAANLTSFNVMVMDGYLNDMVRSYQSNGSTINELFFGYVEKGIVSLKVIVYFKEGILTNVKWLDVSEQNQDVKMINTGNLKIIILEKLSKTAFKSAENKMKNVTIGMDTLEVMKIMGIQLIELKGKIGQLGDGYLDYQGKYYMTYVDNDKKVIDKWPFGFVNKDLEIPKIIIKFENYKVSKIVPFESVAQLDAL